MIAPGYCNLSPFVQKEEVVGRNNFLDIFEMILPKAPTSTCRVKDVALSYSADETDYIEFIYKKFYTSEMSQTFTTFLPSSEF